MHFVNYFNRTYSETTGYWPIYRGFLIGELVMVVLDMLIASLIIYLNEASKQFHLNMRRIFTFYYLCYLTHNTARIVQLIIVLTPLERHDDQIYPLFVFSSYARAAMICLSFIILPAFIVERVCATCFLDDYESNTRGYIYKIIVAICLVFCTIGGYFFQSDRATYTHLIFAIFMNSMGSGTNLYLLHINAKYYYSTMKREGEYSLKQRYQISENLKTLQIWKKSAISISIMNIILVFSLAVDNFNVSQEVKNIAVITFNYSCCMYGTQVSYITFRSNNLWRQEFRRLIAKLFHSIPRSITVSDVSMMDSFGKQMDVAMNDRQRIHFNFLAKEWA